MYQIIFFDNIKDTNVIKKCKLFNQNWSTVIRKTDHSKSFALTKSYSFCSIICSSLYFLSNSRISL